MPLRTGKLEPAHLADLLRRHATQVPRVVIAPRVGEDAAVIELPDRYLVVGTDPVTLVDEEIGHYVVAINANDVATLGARPLFFSCVLLFPAGATELVDVEQTFAGIARACEEHGVAWIGGHTEVTPAVWAPLAVGQMLGEVAHGALVRKESARVGDIVLLTKGLAIEAVSIIARLRADEVRATHGDPFLARARRFLYEPGIGIVREALAAAATGAVHAMHDPTEGGLATGLAELAEATGLGLSIDADAIPVYPEARELCDELGLDPLGVIASGSLLVVADRDAAFAVVRSIGETGVSCSVIGEVVAEPGCRFLDGSPLPSFAVDEITRLVAR